MHAIRQYEFGGPDVLAFEEVPDLDPASEEVRIAVRASGVHLLDTSIRQGEDFGSLPLPVLPMTPGREVAGVIDRIGPEVDASWLGKRVVAHLGASSGGYADQALSAVDRVHEVPENLTLADAVATIGTGRTAIGILDLAPVEASDVVLIPSAAGGLGSTLVQHAKSKGAYAIGLAGGAKKNQVVRTLGADDSIDYLQPDWESRLRVALGGRTPTLVYDGVSGEVGLALYTLLGKGGRIVQFGWSSRDQAAYEDPERPVLAVLGPQMLARPGGLASLEAEALAKSADGTALPVVGSTFPLSQAAAAHRALESRETHGKVVLISG